MEGDGASQFEDITGGGLGEGEGAKDVSDQIESEDQVSTLYIGGVGGGGNERRRCPGYQPPDRV